MKKWKKWLMNIAACSLSAMMLVGCGTTTGTSSQSGESQSSEAENDGLYTVTFDLCTDLPTNYVQPQKLEEGDTVTKPVVAVTDDSKNPDNMEVEGWYIDREYTEKWSFLTDTVEGDMTLYAKWVRQFKVTYYLGDSETAMFSENYQEGEALSLRQDLSDGYDSDGFFTSPDYTEEVEDGTPVTGDMNVYIHRSDEIYFSASMIANRFSPRAAAGAGSKVGSMTLVGEGEDAYAEADFGYSTSGDPHMLLEAVTLDISASQTLRVTMRNLGGAEALRLYFVSWYDDETKEFVNGQVFNEDCAGTYYFTPEQKHMSEDDEWITFEIDMAEQTLTNGVSYWGSSEVLLKIRLQASYVSKSEDDKNVLQIKSIEGIKDDKYVSTEDSKEVQDELYNDRAADVYVAAQAQEAVNGFVFPKDNALATGNDTLDIYEHTDGLMLHTAFRATKATLNLNAVDKGINLDEYSTLKIRLRNYGYATSFTLQYRNAKGRSGSCDLAIRARTDEVVEYTYNMYGEYNFNDVLQSLAIVYNSVGNDNGIMIESIVFDEFVARETAGFNFDDKNTFGITSSESMEVSYDKTNGGTKFNVLQSEASFAKDYNLFANTGYATMKLNYASASETIEKVIVRLMIDGVETAYTYTITEGAGSIELPLEKTGYISRMQVIFIGSGEITLKSISFTVAEGSGLDLSNSTYSSALARMQWSPDSRYNKDNSSLNYTYGGEGNEKSINCYIGYCDKDKLIEGLQNFSMAGKTKMVIIYQNRTDNENPYISVGLGMVSEEGRPLDEVKKTGYLWDVEYPGYSGGQYTISGLKKNMAAGEWASCEVNLSEYYVEIDQGAEKHTPETLAKYYVSSIFLTPNTDINIRAIIFC